jgi:DNA polymerase-1
MQSQKKSIRRLYLVDGSSYIFRAYHATERQRLSTSSGLPTGAIYVFTNMLRKLLKDEAPEYLAVVWDAPGKTFREDSYPDYKATRKEVPEDLVPQFDYIRKVVKAFNIATLEKDGYEADDVIATMVEELSAQDLEIVIVSGDKDLTQILGPKVSMLDTMKDRRTDPALVKDRFGVEPERVVDLLALMGDASDNVPGVPGIGEKTAKKLIAEYRTLENLLKHADNVPGKVGENLKRFAEQARLSKNLVTLVREVPVSFSLEELKVKTPDREKLARLFSELEFQKLLAEYSTAQKEINTDRYQLVQDEKALSRSIKEMERARAFALDLETTSPDPMQAEIVGISFCARPELAYYIPVGHSGLEVKRQLSKELVLKRLKSLLEDPKLKKIGQNIKYDYIVLNRAGVKTEGIAFDTMVASYLLNPRRNHNLNDLALEHLNHKMLTYEEVCGRGKDQINFSEVELETALRYSGEDADVTLRLSQLFAPRLKEQEFQKLFDKVEMPLVTVLARMEMNGVKIDVKLLEEISRELEERGEIKKQEIYRLAGEEFNIDSPKQLQEILFEKLKLPRRKKTKTGYSTRMDVLVQLAEEHPLPKHLLEYRTLSKLKSTYAEALPRLVHPATGRLHTSFNQAITATGRLSSSEPNLQNIPVRTPEGRRIRQAFIAEGENLLLSSDYSQVELRLLAHISGDSTLLESFEAGEDIHRRTAAEVFGVAPDLVTEEMRRQAKVINFGITYGMSEFGLSQELGIPRKQARIYIDEYFRRYPGAYRYVQDTIERARRDGHITTIFNRRCFFPEIKSKDPNIRRFAEREAINAPMQGSAADIIKMAMVKIDREIKRRNLKTMMILQVHDELVFEVPPEELEEVRALVQREMEAVADLKAPLKVDIKAGKNWAEAH